MTCTLGEVKNRADFILYWGGNPAECHPRHFTKYTLTQRGKFVPNGRKGRTMFLVDIRETPSAKAADVFLQVRPTKDFELITALRAIVKGQPVDPRLVEETGLTMGQVQDFADRTCHLGDGETRWLAMKGVQPDDELQALPEDFRLESCQVLKVPGCQGQRHLLILRRSMTGTGDNHG